MNGLESARDSAGRQAWLAERRRGIGASDSPAILGFSPWRTALDVWLEKTGQAPPFLETEPIWWGRALEDLVAQRYAEKTGAKIWNPDRLYQHKGLSMILATPDRLVLDEADPSSFSRGLEVKTARSGEDWGPPGGDEIPAHYLIQCLQCMAVLDLDRWDVAVLVGGSDHRIYSIRRDPAFEARILEMLEAWWERHIVKGERPLITGAESARCWLRWKFPLDSRPIMPAPAEAIPLVSELSLARSALAGWEERTEQATNRLKALIEDAAGFEGTAPNVGRFRLTWKKARASSHVDWETVARALLDAALARDVESIQALFEKLVKEATLPREGARRFLLKILKEGAE